MAKHRHKLRSSSRGPTQTPDRERLIGLLVCVFLAVAVWIVFGRTLHFDFLDYDDNAYVYDNPKITGGFSLGGVAWAFTHIHAENWHPLTTISHMLDVQFYGLNPWGHHLTNVLLHAAAAILLFLALRKLTLSFWPSAFVAALFAIHPLRVESVAWVSERKDALSGVFFALTLFTYAGYARESAHRIRNYVLVIICFALGLLCKPTLVPTPFVLLLLDYWPLRRLQGAGSRERGDTSKAESGKSEAPAFQRFSVSAFRSLVVEKIPLFLLSVASCAVTIFAQKAAFDTMRRLTFHEHFANAVISYVVYVGQMFCPVNLTPLNPYTQTGPGSLVIVIALIGLWIATIAFFLWRKRFPFLLVGWLWYAGMLVPVSGIVQVGRQTHADRYTYLPEIGLYVLVTWAALELINSFRLRRGLVAAAAAVILIVFGTVGYIQTGYWKDSETLWSRALAVDPKNYVAHNNLGNSVMARGNVDEGIGHFKAAIEADPTYADGHYNLGNALAEKKQFLEAIPAFQAAIRERPKFYQAYNNQACMLMNVGKTDDAIARFNEALKIQPDYVQAHLNLGQLLNRLGRTDEGAAHLAEAARLEALQPGKEVSSVAVPQR